MSYRVNRLSYRKKKRKDNDYTYDAAEGRSNRAESLQGHPVNNQISNKTSKDSKDGS